MQKVLSAKEMREVDRLTTETYGIPSLLLMENAAHAAARVITEKLGGSADGKSVLVLCGKGNNGGDGAALARILWTLGADVEVCLFGLIDDTKEDACTNFKILRNIVAREGLELSQADLAFEEITGLDEWFDFESVNFNTDDPDIIVDALFGTGLSRPLDGLYEQVAGYLSAFKAASDDGPMVVSLDLPSGLDSDNPAQIGLNANAHATVTFTAPKLANVMPPASTFNGDLYVEKIGSPVELVNAAPSQLFVSDVDDAREWLARTEFSSDSYKKKRGQVLIAAGSTDFAGAAVLCGNAAMRSGAGVVTVATPEAARPTVSAQISPEVIVRGLASLPDGAFSEDAFSEFSELSLTADAIAIGSGLTSENESTRNFVRKVVENRNQPVVIDADGLNALSPFELQGSDDLPIILTPHEGEFSRLLGDSGKKPLADRVEACRAFAVQHHAILLLKGERALIAAPDGRVTINPTGNSGLGKAGNGDTLTGIIVGFVAQAAKLKVDAFETVIAAVYIAGLAGDIAECEFGKRVMTASDVGTSLAQAFREIQS